MESGEGFFWRFLLLAADAKGSIREIILPKGLDLDRPKRTRTSFTAEQLYRLEMEFHRCQYVVGRERTELARQLNLSETQVCLLPDRLSCHQISLVDDGSGSFWHVFGKQQVCSQPLSLCPSARQTLAVFIQTKEEATRAACSVIREGQPEWPQAEMLKWNSEDARYQTAVRLLFFCILKNKTQKSSTAVCISEALLSIVIGHYNSFR